LTLDLVDLLGEKLLTKLLLQLLHIDQLILQLAALQAHPLPEIFGNNRFPSDRRDGRIGDIGKLVNCASDDQQQRQPKRCTCPRIEDAVTFAVTLP
jgi:hypothetical protein